MPVERLSAIRCERCREAFKMVVLLPLVPLRIMLILVSLTCLATCSYLAALGWCVPPAPDRSPCDRM